MNENVVDYPSPAFKHASPAHSTSTVQACGFLFARHSPKDFDEKERRVLVSKGKNGGRQWGKFEFLVRQKVYARREFVHHGG